MVKCNTTSWMEPWDRKRTLGFSDGSVVEDLPAKQEMHIRSLGREGPLEKEMAIHSSFLACGIPLTEEPGELTVHGITKSQT